MENQLRSFINVVLVESDDSIVSIDIVANKLITGEIRGKKNCILDLRSVASDGRHFIVEVQRKDQILLQEKKPTILSTRVLEFS